MGQHYKAINVDRKEYVAPRASKLWDLQAKLSALFPYLLRESDGRGDGDPTVPLDALPDDEDGGVDIESYSSVVMDWWPNEGRWAGDRVALVGDYSDSGLYHEVEEKGEWQNITDEVLPEVRRFGEGPRTDPDETPAPASPAAPDIVLQTRR